MIRPNSSQMSISALLIGITILIPLSQFKVAVEAQPIPGSISPKGGQIKQSGNIITIVGTLYGINSTTGKVAVFATIGGVTEGKIVDATLSDRQDKNKDGILEIGLTMANVTVQSGTKFRACAIVLTTLQTVCETGHKSPSLRAEFVELVLNDYNSTKIQQNMPLTTTKNPTR